MLLRKQAKYVQIAARHPILTLPSSIFDTVPLDIPIILISPEYKFQLPYSSVAFIISITYLAVAAR
jgi:hypothetical protein